jgi:hypothetical protein
MLNTLFKNFKTHIQQMTKKTSEFVKKFFFQKLSKISKDDYHQLLIFKVSKELVKLILILFLIILLKEGIRIYPLQANIIIMLIIGVGLTLDSRFPQSRVCMFLVLCINI